MKNSEPIRVEINILRGRDWTKAGHYCLEFRSHVGARTRIRALICQDPSLKTRPCKVLLRYWPNCLTQPRPPRHPPLLLRCFSIREERKYPSRELHGLARAEGSVVPLLEARELISDIISLRCSVSRDNRTKTTRLLETTFKVASTTRSSERLSPLFGRRFLFFLLFLYFLQTLLCSTHACSRTRTHE